MSGGGEIEFDNNNREHREIVFENFKQRWERQDEIAN